MLPGNVQFLQVVEEAAEVVTFHLQQLAPVQSSAHFQTWQFTLLPVDWFLCL
jgi:hypothetical protein